MKIKSKFKFQIDIRNQIDLYFTCILFFIVVLVDMSFIYYVRFS